jgi:hypothetical protein
VPPETVAVWFWALKVRVVAVPFVVMLDQLPSASRLHDCERDELAIVSSCVPLWPEDERVPRAKATWRLSGSYAVFESPDCVLLAR